MNDLFVKKYPYEYSRAVILADTVTRNIVRTNTCNEYSLGSPLCLFGSFGDAWDGTSNEYVTDSEITRWKEFLMVDDNIYREYFSLDSFQRRALWNNIIVIRHSEHFGKELNRKIHDESFIADTEQSRHLLLLRRLSKIYLDEMFIAGADEDNSFLKNSINIWQKFGPDGLFFDGQPNAYLSQATIDEERKWLEITEDEFQQFYQLNPFARMLLIESMHFF